MGKYDLQNAARHPVTIAVGLALGVQSANATTFSITTNADSGAGSLRQAIIDANGDAAAPHTLDFSSISGQTITLASDLPAIAISMDLQGSDVTLEGNGSACLSVPYDSYNPDIDLAVRDMTITGCTGTDDGYGYTRGGAILGDQFGTVLLDGVTLTGNTANSGGAVRVADMDLTVLDSTISGNTAIDGFGGGINHTGAAFVMERSAVTGNSAPQGNGGGVYTSKYGADILDSTISENTAYNAGGLFSYQKYSDPSTTLSNVTISANTAGYNAGGALIYNGDGTYDMTTTMSQVTIAANSAAVTGGGVLFSQYDGATHNVTISNSIVSANTAAGAANDFEGELAGGGGNRSAMRLGMRSPEERRRDFKPRFTDQAAPSFGDVPRGSVPVAIDVVFSILGTLPTSAVTLTTDAATDAVVGSDPQLGPLQDNGGPTPTHLIGGGSSAVDLIPNGVNGCGTVLTTDQRGEPRPFAGGDCDAGSVEILGFGNATAVPTLDRMGLLLMALGIGMLGMFGYRRSVQPAAADD